MSSFDDSDIKIAKSDEELRADEEAKAELFCEMQKANGNLEKAQKLGARLADLIDELDLSEDGRVVPALGEIELNSERVLMIFSVVAGLEGALPNTLIIRTALNAYYNTLKALNPTLYDYMSSSGAFSFYYLGYRRGGDIVANVAKAFTMLCQKEDDEELLSEGARIYTAYFNYTRALISEYKFEA